MGTVHKTVTLDGNDQLCFDSLTINIQNNEPNIKQSSTESNQIEEESSKEKSETNENEQTETKKDTLKIPLKSRYLAAFLACTLGRFGIHKFYLKKPAQGVIYLFLSTTHISFVLGLLEGVIYLLTDKRTWMEQVGFIEK